MTHHGDTREGHMTPLATILVVEDNELNAQHLLRLLTQNGYAADWATNGEEALQKLAQKQYAAVLTDWMMPKLDGPGLVRKISETVRPLPVTMMVTILNSPETRRHALDVVGVDAYIQKPYQPSEILTSLETALNKVRAQKMALPALPALPVKSKIAASKLAFPVVGVAASTGGPVLVRYLLEELRGILPKTAILVVQHGPAWMLESFVDMVCEELKVPCRLGSNDSPLEKGCIYVAPGDRHMILDATGQRVCLTDGPAENFCKPSADPTFRSLGEVGGNKVVSVVLTGLGRDGGLGAKTIAHCGGTVIVQDPKTCAAPYMPTTAIELGAAHQVLSPEKIPPAVEKSLRSLVLR